MHLDSKDILFPQQQKEYCAHFQATLIGPHIIDQIDKAKALLHDPEGFYNFSSYAEVQRIIQRGLKMISTAYYPTEITLSSFEMKSPLLSVADILAAIENEQENPFIMLYEDYFLRDILKEPLDVLGISIISVSQIVPGLTLARLVKSHCPEVHIVIGGSIFTRLIDRLKEWPEIFGQIFDSVIVYEGEIPLLELCRRLSKRQNLASVPNLLYKKENGSVRVNKFCLPERVDLLPTPCFDGFPLDLYFSPFPILPIISSRGCYWGRCAFCDHGVIYSNRYNPRRVDLLIDDLRTLSNKYSTKFFTFNDEGIAPSHLREIAKAIVSEGLEVKCNADIRLESQFTPDLLQLAFRSGFRVLYFGLESGCDRVLAHMCKGIDCQTAKAVFQNSSNAGIWNHAFIFFGFPSETETEARKTMDFIFANKDIIHSVGHTTFLLTRCSQVMKNPKRFGITDIYENSSGVLGLWASYSGTTGLTQEQAQNIAKEFSQRIREEYSDWYIWGMMPREHLLLYLAHYKTRELSVLSNEACRPDYMHPARLSVQADEACAPQLKSSVLCGIARFDVARIMLSEESQGEDILSPKSLAILWDLETGKTISVTPSAAAILARCDGQRTLAEIVNEIAEEYSMPMQKVTVDCKKIIESMIKVGLCTIKGN
jgi:hypothetical protein